MNNLQEDANAASSIFYSSKQIFPFKFRYLKCCRNFLAEKQDALFSKC